MVADPRWSTQPTAPTSPRLPVPAASPTLLTRTPAPATRPRTRTRTGSPPSPTTFKLIFDDEQNNNKLKNTSFLFPS